MPNELDGKVAIITGGASGMGQGTARTLRSRGCRVVIADIQEARGSGHAAELGAAACFRITDVSKANQMESLVEFTLHRYGRLDVMFNNAGLLAQAEPTFGRR